MEPVDASTPWTKKRTWHSYMPRSKPQRPPEPKAAVADAASLSVKLASCKREILGRAERHLDRPLLPVRALALVLIIMDASVPHWGRIPGAPPVFSSSGFLSAPLFLANTPLFFSIQ